MTQTKILLTGGAGFIGSHTVIHFVKNYPNYHVINVDKVTYCSNPKYVARVLEGYDNYTFVRGDVSDRDFVQWLFRAYKIDVVLHLASETHVDNSFINSIEFTRSNVLGTHQLLEAARAFKVEKFIYVSTDEVYGDSELSAPEMDENQRRLPTNPYAATKASAELLVESYHQSFNLPTIITRSNNVYGPMQYPEKLIPKCLLRLGRKEKAQLHGTGTNSRRYLYIDDVVSAFDTILHKGKSGQRYNIGTSCEKTNLEVVHDVLHAVRGLEIKSDGSDFQNRENRDDCLSCHECGIKENVEFVVDRPFNDNRYTINSSKIRDLGWTQKVEWASGLLRTIDWYRKHGDLYEELGLEAHPSIPPEAA